MSIKKNEQGRYKVTVTKRIDGKKVYRRATAETLKEAQAEENRLRRELEQRAAENEVPRNTVASYAIDWLMVMKMRNRKPSTLKGYTAALTDHLLPEIGHVSLSELERQHVIDCVTRWETKEKPSGELYSVDTVRGWWRISKMFLQDAYAEGLLVRDVTFRVKGPEASRATPKKREQATLSQQDVAVVLLAVRELYPQRYAEVAVLAWTGIRPGEMYALEWADVDFDERVITISKAVWNGVVGRPKTNDPREVPMNDIVFDALSGHESPGELVFPANNGEFRTQASLTKVFRAVERNTDIDVRLGCQVLRRSFNTMLRARGTHDNVIRAIMGHTTPAMTYRYDGVPIEDKLKAVEV